MTLIFSMLLGFENSDNLPLLSVDQNFVCADCTISLQPETSSSFKNQLFTQSAG
jgi:hypothetical protein